MPSPRTSDSPAPDLERRLTLFDATLIIVGSIIGVGIFTTTGLIAEALPNPRLILLVWVVGGLLTLCGALTYAELGSALPRAGGEYVYLQEAYGPFVGFLNGWTYFLVTNPGSIAAMSIGVIHNVEPFVPWVSLQRLALDFNLAGRSVQLSTGHATALLLILFFSAVNYCGVRFGSLVQNALTLAKLGGILAFVGFGLVVGEGRWDNFSHALSPTDIAGLPRQLSQAMIAVIFAFTGWFASTYVASEIREPRRNVPYSIICGTLVVVATYFVINVAYLYGLPVERMKGIVNVGESAALALFGHGGSVLVSLSIVISILGAMNSVILTAPRIYYAMARDGLFFRTAGAVHPRFRSPGNSIVIQAVWSCLLALSGSFGQLLTYTVVAMLGFSILTAVALFVLRRRRPELDRPYRTSGYPWVPLLFIFGYLMILANVLVASPREALSGLVIVAAGVPAYLYWKRKPKA